LGERTLVVVEMVFSCLSDNATELFIDPLIEVGVLGGGERVVLVARHIASQIDGDNEG
jgi:hypothetical protein